jgi:limonene-1,2-epoxide hydrolase
VRFRPLLLLGVALAAGCGSGSGEGDTAKPATPEQIVRAWSAALNRGDDRGAAELFADGARITQGDVQYTLPDRGGRLEFNSGLPCSGEIVDLHASGGEVTATFELGERTDHRCDAPGARTTAVFTIRGGRIVAFRQLLAPEQGPTA